jgi:hypothetical protein
MHTGDSVEMRPGKTDGYFGMVHSGPATRRNRGASEDQGCELSLEMLCIYPF